LRHSGFVATTLPRTNVLPAKDPSPPEGLIAQLRRRRAGPLGSRSGRQVKHAFHPRSRPALPGIGPARAGRTPAGDPIRIALADDHDLLREALVQLLDAESDFEVVGEARDGDETVRLARELRPDILLLDLDMPLRDGLAVSRELVEGGSTTRIVLLTGYDHDHDALAEIGISGYVSKSTPFAHLNAVIRAVHAGHACFPLSGGPAAREEPRSTPDDLPTARELEVLRLVTEGLRDRDIASRACITERTVRFHLRNLFRKARASSRTELARVALTAGWIDYGGPSLSKSTGRGLSDPTARKPSDSTARGNRDDGYSRRDLKHRRSGNLSCPADRPADSRSPISRVGADAEVRQYVPGEGRSAAKAAAAVPPTVSATTSAAKERLGWSERRRQLHRAIDAACCNTRPTVANPASRPAASRSSLSPST
jgi:DNA-binding NarL/FixJ family response regulator